MTRHFNVDWLKGKIENFERFVGPLAGKPSLRFLEIGSFEGMTSCWLMDNILTHPSSTLTAVDPCDYYPIPGWDHLINPGSEKIFRSNVNEFGSRVIFHKALSADVFPFLQMNYFDFAYVDGDHRRDSVYRDAVSVLSVLKVGGIVIFDDYTWGYKPALKDNPLSPQDGVDRFLFEHPTEVEVLAKNLQLVARRIS